MCLPVHLPGRDHVIFQEGNEQVAATAAFPNQTATCACLLTPPSTSSRTVSTTKKSSSDLVNYWTDQIPDRPHYVHRRQRGQTICRMNILYPSSGDVFYLKLLLLHTSPRSFEEARTVDGTVYTTCREAAQALACFTMTPRDNCASTKRGTVATHLPS